ncbi:MAG: hypothetical protein IJW55_04425 [Clostridia bacterium]|nr:hypothetical protein [Clostridia bacterium]
MSKIKPRRADVKEVFDGFAGLGTAKMLGDTAAELCNFRLLADGSLEKRCGWQVWEELLGEVRGVWQGPMDGTSCVFAVSEDTVYRIANGRKTAVGGLMYSSGRVEFVLYRGHLYLLDGDRIYVYAEALDTFEAAPGYAPMYGRNWHPTEWGEVNEPLNLFSKRLRVHYYNSTGTTTFILPYYAQSIDLVRVDNAATTGYSFTAGSNSITLSSVGAYVEIAFTMLYTSTLYTQLQTCTRAFLDYAGDREALLLWGGEAGETLFCSAQVDGNMLNACKVAYTDADPLYCKASGVLTVGDRLHPVTTLCHDRDRILAFHALGAASVTLSEEDDTVDSYALLRGVGCTAHIDLTLNGDTVILNEGGIFKLSSTAAEPDDFELTCLSDGVRGMLTASFLKNATAFADTAHGELWFRDVTDTAGTVWVYHTVRKQWYTFDGMVADFFLSVDGCCGFASDNQICLFDETLTTDGGAAFQAVWQSGWLGFSSPEAVKRSLRMTLCAEGAGNTAELTFQTEKRERMISLQSDAEGDPVLFDRRLTLGRFTLLRVRLCDSGTARSRYGRLALYANL